MLNKKQLQIISWTTGIVQDGKQCILIHIATNLVIMVRRPPHLLFSHILLKQIDFLILFRLIIIRTGQNL